MIDYELQENKMLYLNATLKSATQFGPIYQSKIIKNQKTELCHHKIRHAPSRAQTFP